MVEYNQYSTGPEHPTEEGNQSQAIYDVENLSNDEEANLGKREVDRVIADELRQQEDSYQEQITSLDIDNSNQNRGGQITITQQAVEGPSDTDLGED